MTRQRSFKRLVRSRMAKTGESYTAARAVLLGTATTTVSRADPAVLPAPDAKILERTGRGWEDWFDLLDDWGASERSHREIAREVAERLDVSPLAWNVQTVVTGYERARLGKAVGEHDDGFRVNVSRTAGVPVEDLYDAVIAASSGDRWLPSGPVTVRTATRPRSARFDAPGDSRIAMTFVDKGETKSSVALEHSRLSDEAAANEMRAWWRTRLDALVADVTGGGDGA